MSKTNVPLRIKKKQYTEREHFRNVLPRISYFRILATRRKHLRLSPVSRYPTDYNYKCKRGGNWPSTIRFLRNIVRVNVRIERCKTVIRKQRRTLIISTRMFLVCCARPLARRRDSSQTVYRIRAGNQREMSTFPVRRLWPSARPFSSFTYTGQRRERYRGIISTVMTTLVHGTFFWLWHASGTIDEPSNQL